MPLCKGKRPDDHVWLNPKTGKPFYDIKRAFLGACEDAGMEGHLWHEVRRGRLQRIRYRQADGPCEYLNKSALRSQFPVGAGEEVMLKISAVTAAQVPRSQSGFGHFDGGCK